MEGCRDVGWGEASLCCSAEGKTAVPYEASSPPALHGLSATAAAGSYLYPVSITCARPPCILPAIYLGSDFFPKQFSGKAPHFKGL